MSAEGTRGQDGGGSNLRAPLGSNLRAPLERSLQNTIIIKNNNEIVTIIRNNTTH